MNTASDKVGYVNPTSREVLLETGFTSDLKSEKLLVLND
jgi:hypothetical protein